MFINITHSNANTIVMRHVLYHTTGHFPVAEMYLGVDSFIIGEGIMNLENIGEVLWRNLEWLFNLRRAI